MAAGVFTIQELRTTDGEEGERFDWVADKSAAGVDTATIASKGGVRACPRGAWRIAGQMRTSRTDYTGAVTPTEQILGPAFEPTELQGEFDDRYNFAGYAVAEMRRLEAMCRRGNRVRVSFQEQAFEGVITQWAFDYKRSWQIGYSLSISLHDRTDDVQRSTARKDDKTPTEALDQALVRQKLIASAQANRPARAVDRNKSETVDGLLEKLNTSITALTATINQREVVVGNSINPFKRIGTHFRNITTNAHNLATTFASVRSDTEMSYRTAINVLDFEDWVRTTTFTARVLMADSTQAAAMMDARDEPDAKRLYRPREGESLYDISRRFYGTPWAWTLIYERNNLSSFELTGDEVLVIPDRVQG